MWIYLVYAFIASISSVVGGLLPVYTRLKNVRTNYLIGFAAGVLISTAVFEMLPEALVESNVGIVNPLALGFFSLYLVEKSVMIHACKETECNIHTAGWVGMIGLGMESILDGIAIAVGYITQPALGLIIAFAVAVHELPVGFSTSVIMMRSDFNRKNTLIALFITSFLTVAGALIAGFFPQEYFGMILAFTAGTFIYIGASDLLPTAHDRINWFVVISVISGAAIVPFIEYVLGI
ncbi:MAG TPA: ZIP family metal transporter [Candidatus Methanoperedens sp.]